MPFVISTKALGAEMFFMDHREPGGFSLTTDKTQAKVYDSKEEAREIADVLEVITPFEVKVTPK